MKNIRKNQIPKEVKSLICLLNKNGEKAYLVGGCVRDVLLNIKPNDWDITTTALPDVVISIFKNEGHRVIETGIKHGTVTVIINKKTFEITTYRQEFDYYDFRRPSAVKFVSDLKEDLKRRDFTINAMAMNINGEIIDYFKGREDLLLGIIKTVGDPEERFSEDALRILRMYRFAARFSFIIEKNTLNKAKQLKNLLKHISKERIIVEIDGIINSDLPGNILNLMYENHTLQKALNTDKYTISSSLNVKFNSINNFFKNDYYPKLAFLYNCLIPISKLKTVLKSMKYSNLLINKVYNIIFLSNKVINCDKYTLRKLLSIYGIETLENTFTYSFYTLEEAIQKSVLQETYKKFKEIVEDNEVYNIKDLKINGEILLIEKIAKGKDIGILLNYALDEVFKNPKVNEKETLLKIVKNKNLKNS